LQYNVTQSELAVLCGANANSISRFLKAAGEFGGKDQEFYLLGAAFVEKLRIGTNKPKSKKRKALEEEAVHRSDKRPNLGLDPDAKYRSSDMQMLSWMQAE